MTPPLFGGRGVLLKDGRGLVVPPAGNILEARIFDPTFGTWKYLPSLKGGLPARLPDGRVAVVTASGEFPL